MKKNLMNLFMLCALTAPLYLGSCAPKAENKQVCENEEKTEVKTMKAESAKCSTPDIGLQRRCHVGKSKI